METTIYRLPCSFTGLDAELRQLRSTCYRRGGGSRRPDVSRLRGQVSDHRRAAHRLFNRLRRVRALVWRGRA